MAHRAALSYAAGEWAYVWPLGRLIGGTGAYFVRQLVEAERGVYWPAPGAEKILLYYANSAYR